MNKKILITGKNGYIATNLKLFLNNLGYTIEIIDLLDPSWQKKDFSNFDVVVHTSALVHKSEKKHTLQEYLDANFVLTNELAKKAKNEGVKHFIFISTQSVYGKAKNISLNTIAKPITKYGKSKLLAEEALDKLRDNSFKTLILRCPMVYGKGCKGNYNQLRSFSLKFHLTIYGNNEKSLLHIQNLCSFIEHAIKIELEGQYCPQDYEYHSTPKMMMSIGRVNDTKVRQSIIFTLIIFLAKIISSKAKKAFGTSVISYDCSKFPDGYNYWLYNNYDAVRVTETDQEVLKSNDIIPNMVSVIMPVFNSSPFLRESITSVLSQSYTNFELIIIDDCSTDDSVTIINQYLNDKRVVLIRNEKNSGTSVTRNNGLARAKGQYIAFLDSDDKYGNDYLEKQIEYLNNNKFSIAYTNYSIFNDTKSVVFKAPKTITYKRLLYQNVFAPLSTIYDRSLIGIHYMREDIIKPEDFVYWLEILEFVGKAHLNNITCSSYRITPNSKSRNKRELIKYMFHIYKHVEKENVFCAIHHLIWWAITGLFKYAKIK